MQKSMVLAAMVFFAVSCGGNAYAAKKSKSVQLTGAVNLNQATASQLDLLPGIGEKAAKRIVDYRSRTPFRRPEELVKVKGFGKKKFDKLKPYLTVTGPTTLAVKKSPEAVAPTQGRTSPPTQ